MSDRASRTEGREPRWVAKAHLNYDFFSLSAVAESYRDELATLVGFPFNYKYENLDVFYDQNDIDRHRALLDGDPASVERQLAFVREGIPLFLRASADDRQHQHREAFDRWYRAFRAFLPALGIVFGLEAYLEARTKSLLSGEDFHAIAFARETSAALEQKSLLHLALLAEDAPAFQKELRMHLQTYAWLGNKMMRYAPFAEQQILDRVAAVRSSAREKLGELEQSRAALEAGDRVVKEKLSASDRAVVEQFQEILFLRTERADAFARAASLTSPLFAWVADHLGYSREEVVRFSKSELDAMLDGGTRLDPAPREKYSALFVNGKFDVSWGSYGREEATTGAVSELRGTVASKGRARGRVTIVIETPDLKKVEAGDILVAPYTNPNFVPAMERAAAIVTNIGGLTSHAAIVSREMNKPCIIGTEVATKVLKDGDEVEVDAEEGVVKVLKRA